MEYRFNNDDNPATLEKRNPDPNVTWGLPPGAPHNEVQIGLLLYQCKISAFDLIHEIPSLPPTRQAVLEIGRRKRSCKYFERYQPILSFREHLEIRLRRGERLWAVGGVLAGIVLTAAADIIVRLVTS
jgi:hypothetical protein